jgi:hypothetical protein
MSFEIKFYTTPDNNRQNIQKDYFDYYIPLPVSFINTLLDEWDMNLLVQRVCRYIQENFREPKPWLIPLQNQLNDWYEQQIYNDRKVFWEII